MARADFEEYYTEDIDYIILIGFSRGAAIINSDVNKQIIIEGVFDTVALIGMPN